MPSPDNSGSFVTRSGEMLVDDVNKVLAIAIPFY
jgi:hypothetical protein